MPHPRFPPPPDVVLDVALDAVLTLDADGCVLTLDPAAEQLFGTACATAVGRPLAELVLPERLQAAHHAGLRRTLDVGASEIFGRRVELLARRADGREIPVELTIARVADQPPRFVGRIRDLSRLRAEEARSQRRQGLLDVAEELTGIGSWLWRVQTGELFWSDNLFRLFGLEPGAIEPSVTFVLDHAHPDDRQALEDTLTVAAETGRLAPHDLRIVWPDGAVRHLHTTGRVQHAERGSNGLIVGAVQDVTEQCLADREIAAHVAVAEALTSWEAFDPGAERLLRELATALGFTVGMLWLPCPQDGVLLRRAAWIAPGATAGELERVTGDLRLKDGVGLSGWAASRRAPVALGALPPGRRCDGSRAATRAGLHGGLAIPALTRDEVLAVVELRSAEREQLSERLERSLGGLAYLFGAFLARRRGELKPPPVTARELEVLQLAATGLSGPAIAQRLFVSPATVKSHLEHIYAKLGTRDRASAVAHALREGLIP
ncbi:MAG: hypothetical protein JWN65_2524 [Solirubrobacterales bacterium]|nr:hypothetical protein [Solirubrobacterales bacterium]